MAHLTPDKLRALLARLTDVETEARTLRGEIEQRLLARRQGDAQDRSGEPRAQPAKARKER